MNTLRFWKDKISICFGDSNYIMNDFKFYEFMQKAKQDRKMLYNSKTYQGYEDIINTVYEDVEQFDIYTTTGEFQDILIKITESFDFEPIHNVYERFLEQIYEEFKKLVVPNIILIPLNNFNIKFDKTQTIHLSNTIKIFNPSKTKHNQSRKRDPLQDFHEKSIHAKLLNEHIVSTKDKYFFENPILAVVIENIACKVEKESSIICEAAYSIIRMIDFDYAPIDRRWEPYGKRYPWSDVYGVYYNLPNAASQPPYDSGYGHSFHFSFTSVLDIYEDEFINRIDIFKKLLFRFVELSFINRKQYSKDELKRIDKWKTAILLYNSAYESASKEKYDLSIIILITALETLFLKNSGGSKKEPLIQCVVEYFKNHSRRFTDDVLEETIKSAYNHRNHFIHEGKSISAYTPKYLNEHQGATSGMKPFKYGLMFLCTYQDATNIKRLFMILGDILTSFWD